MWGMGQDGETHERKGELHGRLFIAGHLGCRDDEAGEWFGEVGTRQALHDAWTTPRNLVMLTV